MAFNKFKVLIIVIVMAVIASLTGCGGKTNSSAFTDGVVFANGDRLKLTEIIGTALPVAAEPLEVQESPSCIGKGTDLNFVYDGLSIIAYPYSRSNSGEHYVAAIKISKPGYRTISDISVGAKHPIPDAGQYTLVSESNGTIAYLSLDGNIRLMLELDDDGTVTFITLLYTLTL